MPLTGRRQHKLCCQSNRANAAIKPGMRQQVLGQPVMLLKYSCCSNADLCKHLLCTERVAGNLIVEKSPCCPGLRHRVRRGYVSVAHACTAQAAADPRKASYCHGTCSRLSGQGLQTLGQLLQPGGSLKRVPPPRGKLQMKAGGRSILDITSSCQALAGALLKAQMCL